MKFDEFLKLLPKIEKNKVDYLKAHSELSPEDRPSFSLNFKTEKTRNAAVMIIFSSINNEAYITLIERTSYDGAHSGQIAFPGGKWETIDQDFLETAYRETEEEIGVSKNKLKFIRELHSVYVPISDFRVHVYCSYSENNLEFKKQESEVADIINLPVRELLNPNSRKKTQVTVLNSKNIEVPAFVYRKYKIWGATSMILNELKSIIAESMD